MALPVVTLTPRTSTHAAGAARGLASRPGISSRAAAIALGVCAAVVAVPGLAAACTCATSCGSILSSTMVFEATVVAVQSQSTRNGRVLEVRLSDVRAVRGGAPPEVVTTAATSGECGYRFRVGERYLVDARQVQPGQYGVWQCSNTRPLAAAGSLLAWLAAPQDERPRVFGRVAGTSASTQVNGPGVPGAEVRLIGASERRTTASPNGDFAFTNVPDGEYRLVVDVPGDRRDVTAPAGVAITLSPGDVCADVTLTARSTSRISGTVVDAAGTAMAGVRVEIYPWPYDQWAGGIVLAATTDAAGRYAIDGIAPGTYAGGAGVPYPSEQNPVAPALLRAAPGGDVALPIGRGEHLDLPPLVATLAPPVTLSGRLSAPPGMKLDRSMLVLQPLDGFATARTLGGYSGPDGRFTLSANRGVRYRVTVEAGRDVVGTAEFVAGDEEIEIVVRPR